MDMQTPLSRRAWFARAASAGFTVAAISTFQNTRAEASLPGKSPSRSKLRLSAAAFRDLFKVTDNKRATPPAADKALDMLDFVDYCADHHCDGAEVTSYYFPATADNAYLLKLKRHAF